nr:hypothetical protein [Actinomycetota bacterium]
DQRREMPAVLVLAEPANETLGSDVANNLGEAIAGALKQRLGVSCSVRVVGVGELPRIEIGKAVRVHRWTAEHNPLPDVLS